MPMKELEIFFLSLLAPAPIFFLILCAIDGFFGFFFEPKTSLPFFFPGRRDLPSFPDPPFFYGFAGGFGAGFASGLDFGFCSDFLGAGVAVETTFGGG